MNHLAIHSILKRITPNVFVSLTGIAAAALLLVACGKSPEPPVEPQVTTRPTTPAPAAEATPELAPAVQTTPEPMPAVEATPEPTPLPAPSPAADTIQEPLRQVWVAMAFQSESEYGTHDFPAGVQVNLLAVEGDDYLVEYEGVSVRNNKAFFSETPVEPAAPVAESSPEPTATPEPEPLATPAPPDALSLEQKKVEDLSGKIQALDAERRALQEEIAQEGGSGEARPAAREKIKELQKERDQLSEQLTEISKP